MTHLELLTDHCVTMEDFKSDPIAATNLGDGEAVAVLEKGEPVFYCLLPELYEQMLEMLDDAVLSKIANERENGETISVDIKTL